MIGRRTLIVCGFLLCACQERAMEVPRPPDLAAVVAAYEAPTGTIDLALASETAALIHEQAPAIDSLSRLVADALTGVRDRLEASGQPTAPDRAVDDAVSIDAVVRVERICGGWDPAATTPDLASNGQLRLSALVQDNRLDRTIWGTAERCRTRIGIDPSRAIDVFVDGSMGIYLYDGLPRRVQEARFLVRVEGIVGGEEHRFVTGLDFRVLYPELEVRVAVTDGDVIVSVGVDSISVRARNGRFECAFETGTCVAAP